MSAKKILVLVESPTKIKPIQKYLGSKYKVLASYGHLIDLPERQLGVDTRNDFGLTYAVIKGKEDKLRAIMQAVKDVDTLIVATDLDREGEAIGSLIADKVKRRGLVVKRIIFNEITKTALQKAIKNPTIVDQNKVSSQQARRALDRLVGFKISPLLWTKLKKGLSAGRVQSAALRIVAERQKEIDVFTPEEYWEIDAEYLTDKKDIVRARVSLSKKIDQNKAKQITSDINNASKHVVSSVETKQKTRRPYPIFTTSTLQQTASSILNWSSKKTMQIAQQLYEGVQIGSDTVGLITYHRTDSTNISNDAITAVRSYIVSNYGAQYKPTKPNVFKTKNKLAQQAHEGIRPTDVTRTPSVIAPYLSNDMRKLYELIFKRFVACQMMSSKYDQTSIVIISDKHKLKTSGKVTIFDGFLKVWTYSTESDQLLPKLKKGQLLNLVKVVPSQHFTKPPARYNTASLIKELETNGIGRPSTYSSTIETLLSRNYIDKDGKAFIATELGIKVSDWLGRHFTKVVAIDFTADLESQLDKIAEGTANYVEVLRDFYENLKQEVKDAQIQMEQDQKTPYKCKQCGKMLLLKTNRTTGESFFGCSGYQTKSCDTVYPMGKDKKPVYNRKVEILGQPCVSCGGKMVKRGGKYGVFYGCENFPKCRQTADKNGSFIPVAKTLSIRCPKCYTGYVIERFSKKNNSTFFGCTSYPKCRFVSSTKPTSNSSSSPHNPAKKRNTRSRKNKK